MGHLLKGQKKICMEKTAERKLKGEEKQSQELSAS